MQTCVSYIAYKFKEYLFAGNSVVVTVNCKYN